MQLQRLWRAAVFFVPLALGLFATRPAMGNGDLTKVKHIIIIMQENHSFDNYFGALAYAPASPYHNGFGACQPDDHNCVDGLSCRFALDGSLLCVNANPEADGTPVYSFHDPKRCAAPDLRSVAVPEYGDCSGASTGTGLHAAIESITPGTRTRPD